MERIACPGCQQSIRLPDEVLGQRAQCPFCKCHFRASARLDDGTLAPPRLLRRNPFAQSRTFAPGCVLVMVGLLACLNNGLNVASYYADPEAFAAKTRDDFARMGERGDADDLKRLGEFTIKWMPIARFGFLGMSVLTTAAGLAMIRQRYHSLAMIGAVAALFNVANCCCVLGFPAGGWALYVLMNPEVRAKFVRSAPKNAPL